MATTWLDKHLREFVLPNLKRSAQVTEFVAPKLFSDEWFNWVRNKEETIGVLHEPVAPFTGQIRPMKMKYTGPGAEEYGVLAAFMKSVGLYAPKYFMHMLAGSAHNPTSGRSLKHINHFLSAQTHLHWYIKTHCRAIRSRIKGTGKQVVLLGRDVWLVSVLCEKMGIPYVFDPRVSRGVVRSEALVDITADWRLREGDVLFDTGFAGSIHRGVTSRLGITLENLMVSAYNRDNQLFPNSGVARNYALAMEYLPKYFKTGTVKDGQVVQYLAPLPEFIESALNTIWCWYHESPAVMKSSEVLPRPRRGFFY